MKCPVRSSVHSEWTESKFWGFIRSGLRAKWVRWPPRYEAIKKARRPVVNKRHKWEVKCAICKKWKQLKEIQVDHIIPVGSLKCYEDLPGFVRRLFVSTKDLRAVCKPCHNTITQEARKK